MRRTRVAAVVVAALAVLGGVAPVGASASGSTSRSGLTGSPLTTARPVVTTLADRPNDAPIPLDGDPTTWTGRAAHLAGTAHYDRGEWIYEDYPVTAYGAALPVVNQVLGALDALASVVPPAARVPGGLDEVLASTGAGPFVADADLSELRFTVRGADLYVLARTTSMQAPARTALLLLFDTGRSGVARAVPFGSGLTTRQADTAVLVTAAGARRVDLVTGAVSDDPAVADPTGVTNTLEARLPLASVQTTQATLHVVGGTGLAAPGTYELSANGNAGPIAKVVPRFDEPVRAVHDHLQAQALATHDIDPFFTDVSIANLRRGTSQRLTPGVGYSIRTFVSNAPTTSEGGTNGPLREYGIYVPTDLGPGPAPATLVLRGSGMTESSLASVTPGLFHDLGDGNHAIVISPGGRSGFDEWSGATYLDVDQALDDATRLLPLDPDRLSVAGYSMGGFGTYLFAATQPDRFAAAFVVEGPVGGTHFATALSGLPDVVPSLVNLRQIPTEIYQGDIDVDVTIDNGLAAADHLQSLGYRYRLDVLAANTHFTPGILNDYSIGAGYLRGAHVERAPAEVRFSRSMPFERAVDLGTHTDLPGRGTSVGLRFDHAWFVRDLAATDQVGGTADADVRTFGRPQTAVHPAQRLGAATGQVGGQVASVFRAQDWQIEPSAEQLRNAFEAQLSGTARITLDLQGMALTTAQPLTGTIHTDEATVMTLVVDRPTTLTISVDGGPSSVVAATTQVMLTLAPGNHTVLLRPA